MFVPTITVLCLNKFYVKDTNSGFIFRISFVFLKPRFVNHIS